MDLGTLLPPLHDSSGCCSCFLMSAYFSGEGGVDIEMASALNDVGRQVVYNVLALSLLGR